jgi:hypothetical protein
MDLKERLCEFLVLIHPAPHTDQWRAVMNPVTNLRRPYKAETPSISDRELTSGNWVCSMD